MIFLRVVAAPRGSGSTNLPIAPPIVIPDIRRGASRDGKQRAGNCGAVARVAGFLCRAKRRASILSIRGESCPAVAFG